MSMAMYPHIVISPQVGWGSVDYRLLVEAAMVSH